MTATNTTPATVLATDEMPESPDQRAEWRHGCQTWRFALVGGQWGEMTVWPNEGRGAVMFGAASQWGDWDPASRILTLDGGERIDADGLSVPYVRNFATFFRLSPGYVPVEAIGSDGVAVFDGRFRLARCVDEARAICRRRGYIGFTISRGESFTQSRLIRGYEAVN